MPPGRGNPFIPHGVANPGPRAQPAGKTRTVSYTGRASAKPPAPYGQPGFTGALPSDAPRRTIIGTGTGFDPATMWTPAQQQQAARQRARNLGATATVARSVADSLTGYSAIEKALHTRTGGDIAKAGVNVAGMLPFGPFGDFLRGLRGVAEGADAAKAAEAARGAKNAVSTAKNMKVVFDRPQTIGQFVGESLQGAKQTRGAQETLRSAERAKRIEAYGKAAQANPTEAGHLAAKAALKGKYPALDWANFKNFTQETFDALHKHITDHPELQGFDKVRAKDALIKARNGTVPTKSEERTLRLAFGLDATRQIMASASRFRQLKALGYDIANVPRSVMASFDVSGILRQALLVATGHPVIWAKNVPDYFRALKSEDVYNAGMEALHNRPNALNGTYERMGVDLTELTPRGSAAAREESFRSPLAEKIPGVRMSGRGFTLFLDKARADLADHLYAKAVKAGKADNQHTLESIGDVVNSMSGRGDLGSGVIGRSQEGLNLLLFSPRLIKSRIDFLNPVWYARLDPIARHQAYRAMGGLVVLMATALEIAKAAGAQVNLDPRSSDFAKIKVGNTRVDLAGGFQQYMRLLSEIATQQKITSTGKVINLTQEGPGKTSDWDVLFGFLRSKLAPLAGAGVDVTQRQNAIGQPLSWNNSVLSRFTPLSGQDAVSVGQAAARSTGSAPAGAAAGLGAFLLSAFGGGVQNYTPKQPKQRGGGSGLFDNNPFTGSSSSGSGSNPFIP